MYYGLFGWIGGFIVFVLCLLIVGFIAYLLLFSEFGLLVLGALIGYGLIRLFIRINTRR
jgi:hypothetical protein